MMSFSKLCQVAEAVKSKPVGLTGRYQYEVPAAEAKQLIVDLRKIGKPIDDRLVQMYFVSTKPVMKGIRFGIFILGFRPGYTGDTRGITKEQWEKVTADTLARIRQTLGNNVNMSIEPWSSERKFDARFETYIKYAEL
jgi:hypothetical protein